MSSRYRRGYEAIAEMPSEAAAHPNIRPLLAWREFDLEVDRRLRRIRDRETSQVIKTALLNDEFAHPPNTMLLALRGSRQGRWSSTVED